MKKIAFWSYKGGAGRTLTLCNVAVELMRMGKNVGIVDLDMEAPGVHLLFNLDRGKIEKQGSLVNLMVSRTIGNLCNFIQEVPGLVSRPPLRGKLYILPALNSPELDEIRFNDDAFVFTNEIFENFIQIYALDHLLIDTRTGFSVMGSLGSIYADATFICMRPDRQNVIGVKQAINAYNINKAKFHLFFSGVPKIEGAEAKFAEVEKALDTKVDVTIPLAPELILGEKIYSLSEPENEICRGYKQIADIIGRSQ